MEKESGIKSEKKVAVTVVTPFRDKYNTAVQYETGQTLEFDAERAKDVVSRGLAEYSKPIG